MAGVLSALLAERGVDGRCDAFEGEAGLFPTAYRNAYDRSVLLDGLGGEYQMNRVGFKPWPTTNRAHAFIEAAQRIASAAPLDLNAIERIVISGGSHIRTFCEPLDMRCHPTGWVQAEDSIPFSVTKALVNGTVVLAEFTPSGLAQPGVTRLVDRVAYRIQPDLGAAALVEVHVRGGTQLVERVDRPLGHPDKPMSDDALRRKFFDCGQHAANSVPRANLERVLDLVERLEVVDNVSLLADLVSPPARSLRA
jgi:2-methylcitrate dehydratase PrpD